MDKQSKRIRFPPRMLAHSRRKRGGATQAQEAPPLASPPPLHFTLRNPHTAHPGEPTGHKQPFLREELLLRLAEMLLCVLKQLVSGSSALGLLSRLADAVAVCLPGLSRAKTRVISFWVALPFLCAVHVMHALRGPSACNAEVTCGPSCFAVLREQQCVHHRCRPCVACEQLCQVLAVSC